MASYFNPDTINTGRDQLNNAYNSLEPVKTALSAVKNSINKVSDKVGKPAVNIDSDTVNQAMNVMMGRSSDFAKSVDSFNNLNNQIIGNNNSQTTTASVGTLSGTLVGTAVTVNSSGIKSSAGEVKNIANNSQVETLFDTDPITSVDDFSSNTNTFFGEETNLSNSGINIYEALNGKIDSDEYQLLLKDISEKYNISEADAKKILENLNQDTLDNYGIISNEIIYIYQSKPEEFNKDFGFVMDKENITSTSSALIIDMYMFANSKEKGGNIFVQNEDGSLSINPDIQDKETYLTEEKNLINENNIDEETINNYLHTKNENIDFKSETLINEETKENFYKEGTEEYDIDKLKNVVESEMIDGKNLVLNIHNDNTPTIINADVGSDTTMPVEPQSDVSSSQNIETTPNIPQNSFIQAVTNEGLTINNQGSDTTTIAWNELVDYDFSIYSTEFITL